MEDIQGLKISEGLARFRGKTERYFGALQKFAAGLPDNNIPFNEAMRPDNLEETKTRIHTLKGVAGNLAVTDIFAYATDFEATLKAGEPSRELYESLCAACLDAVDIIAKNIKTADSAPGASLGDAATCAKLLSELRAGAESYDPGACDALIKKLKASTWDKVNQDELNKILSLAEDYEYDEAIELIDELRNRALIS